MAKKNDQVKFEQPSELLLMANRYTLAITGVVVLAVLTLGYFFLLRPSIAGIRLSEETAQESQEIGFKNQELLDKVIQLNDEYEDIRIRRADDLVKLKTIVPEGQQIAEMFVMADKLAKNRGFQLDSIDIVDQSADDVNQPVNPSSEQLTNLSTGADIGDGELPAAISETISSRISLKSILIHLNISTKVEEEKSDNSRNEKPDDSSDVYEDFKVYLSDLENNLRLMEIQSVSFGNLSDDTASFSIDVITYYR